MGALAAAGAVKNFANESIELAKRQIQAERALYAALGETRQGLLDYAASLQQVTTYGDEAIIEAQAIVGAFVKEEEQIKRLMPAILDLAAAKGMDLKSAADIVTKSVASSTNALGRYGIEVEGAEGSTERLDSAIASITAAYGGFAQELAKTDVGAIEQAQNAIGDIKEKLGNDLLPLQLEWNSTLLETFTFWSDIYDKAKELLDLGKSKVSEDEMLLENLKLRKKELEKIVNLQTEMKNASGLTVLGSMFDPGVLEDAQRRLDGINKKIEEISSKSSRTAPTTGGKSTGGTQKAESPVDGEAMFQNLSKWEDMIRQAEYDTYSLSQAILKERGELFLEQTEQDIANIDRRYDHEMQRMQEAQQMREMLASAAISTAQSVAGSIVGMQEDALSYEVNARKKAVKESAKSEQQKQTEIEAIDRAAFEERKKMRVSDTIIDAAAAGIRVWASPGFPAAIPLSGMIAASTGAAIARISAQKFATGGIVEGPSSGDRVPVYADGGEMFLNMSQQAQLFDMIANGAGGTKQIVINVTGGGSPADNADAIERTIKKLQFQGRI